LGDQPRLALVGAGGKTTALFRLARQLSPPVLVAGSAHLGQEQASLADRHYIITGKRDLEGLSPPPQVALFTGPADEPGKLVGLSPDNLEALYALAEAQQVPLLIEADGSRGLPLKAPAGHEPVIPSFVTGVVVIAGLSGLDRPLEAGWVHRPELFASLSGLSMGQPVSSHSLERVLVHPRGGLKGIPEGVDRVALLNQADDPARRDQARGMAPGLLGPYRAVLVASLNPGGAPPADGALTQTSIIHAVYERTAGVVLAAGESRRYGAPKQLLDWRGQPLVRHAAQAALRAGLDPVLAVVGAYRDRVIAALERLDVLPVENPRWETGQSSSVKAAVGALPAGVGSAVFLLADQPHIPPALIRDLVDTHAASLAPVVAPRIAGRRANPVLFDRNTFPELLSLSGDVGGRGLFARHPVAWVEWGDPSILLDIDTPEDYQALLDA
jgi:molybdenum cofactor cytidylyltransferase